jgi:hypothetical protein
MSESIGQGPGMPSMLWEKQGLTHEKDFEKRQWKMIPLL